MTTLKLSDINDNDRVRQDLGDIEGLATSIHNLGRGVNRPLQPLVIRRDDNKLIVGGRRLSALRLLSQEELIEGVHFLFQEDLSEDVLLEMELEENVRRKNMDWKENVHAIAKIHNQKKRQAVLNGEEWGDAETGELLGLSRFPVLYANTISKILKSEPVSEVAQATSLRDAIDVLIQQRARITQKEEASRLKAKMAAEVPASMMQGQEKATGVIVNEEANSTSVTVPLSNQFLFGDCLAILDTMEANSVDHCITDPPYAIDMDNIQQPNMGMDVSSTAAEHEVDENLILLKNVFPLIHRVLKPTSFFILWYDLDHHTYLQKLAVDTGFKVQRWPFVWCKSSPCQNGAAQYNFTKKTEVAMVLRREHAQLAQPAITNYKEDSNGADKILLGHPFVKPTSVWRMLLEAVSCEGHTILDPFAGVGSCPLTALLTHRIPIAIEKVQTHYDRMLLNAKGHYENWYHPKGKTVTFV